MAIGDIVLDRHKLLFAAVAREPPIGLGLWILVRGTNKESLEYLSRDDYKTRYTPKPIDCKAKTARKGPCAGLVINPHNVQNAFDGDDLNKAIKLWDDLHEKGNPLVFIGIKAAITTTSILAAERMWKNHNRTGAIVTMAISNGMMAFVAQHNAAVISSLQ